MFFIKYVGVVLLLDLSNMIVVGMFSVFCNCVAVYASFRFT